MIEQLNARLRQHEAHEELRRTQQGYGKAIISAEVGKVRVVAVGNRLFQSTRWRFFTDFLLDYVKDALGRDWGRDKSKENYPHPLFRWLQRLNDERKGEVGDFTSSARGYVTSTFRLAYALYQIAHNDSLADGLVRRLRVVETFNAAYCETLAFAAFAVAGFKVTWAETEKAVSTPEFWAVSPSGKRFSVEAKFKNGWKAKPVFASPEFRQELRQWIRDKLHACLKKRLDNLVIWLELGIADPPLTPDEWRLVDEVIASTLQEAETMTLAGIAPQPAYVFVTNNAHITNDDIPISPTIAFLQGYRMESMKANRYVELEVAMEHRDLNREIVRVFECIEEVQQIPTTFDGTPPELLGSNGMRVDALSIGQRLAPAENAPAGTGVVEIVDIVSAGDKATLIVKDEQGHHFIYEAPLGPEEQRASQRYGDLVFGNAGKKRRELGNNPIRLYDWLLETFSTYDRDALCRQIPGHPMLDTIRALPLDEMRVRVAREAAKTIASLDERSRGTSASEEAPGV